MIPKRPTPPLYDMIDFLGPEEPVVPVDQVVPVKYYEDPDFVDYIKNAENAGRTGYNSSRKLWFPHTSPEGGRKTIGYGYKLKGSDNFSGGISDKQANKLLTQQLGNFDQKMRKELGADYGKLDDRRKGMLMDIMYNTGSSKGFPKFIKALKKGDEAGMRSESKRYYKKNGIPTELTRRNKLFIDQFFND